MNTLTDKIKNKKPLTIAFLGDSVTQGCFELRIADSKSFEPVYRPWEAYSKKCALPAKMDTKKLQKTK